MAVFNKIRPTILMIHGNPNIARYFEGVLRNGFRTHVFMSCNDALSTVKSDPPDLILCDAHCLAGNTSRQCKVMNRISPASKTPLIVVIGERPDQNVEMKKLELDVMDFVHESINPRLLVWKVKNWLCLKLELEELHNSELVAREEIHQLRTQADNLTHDLRSSVLAIRGFVRRLKKLLLTEPVGSKVQSTVRCLDDTCQTVESLLEEFSGLGDASQSEQIRMDEIAQEIVRQYQQIADTKGIKLQIAATSPSCLVKAGKCQVKQILDNLVTNAIKHMGPVLRPQINISIVQIGNQIVTHVSDNGIGIPRQYHNKVFNRFFRVPGQDQKTGNGLGLSIVKELVKRYDGRIWLESEPSKGTTFSFSLPQSVSTECQFESKMVY
jgi:signal transduction histidine kinase